MFTQIVKQFDKLEWFSIGGREGAKPQHILHLLIFCLLRILTATLCPVSSCCALFTLPKLPWPSVSPRMYLVTRGKEGEREGERRGGKGGEEGREERREGRRGEEGRKERRIH